MAANMKTKAHLQNLLLAVVVVFATVLPAAAQQVFKTPEEAAESLVAAVKAQDKTRVLTILGPNGRDIASSGDEVADKTARELFLAAYAAKQSLQKVDDKTSVLLLGAEDWPFPIPVVRAGAGWRFDTATGRQEILYRRIGRNELDTIETCFSYVEAQNDYAEFSEKEFGKAEYAQRIISTPGKKDGLYWPATNEKDESPLGEFIAVATDEGYTPGQSRVPYHGYYFKVLSRQGASAPGGAVNYVVQGKMTGGFALVAWPAEYGNSGVKTFLVNQLGVVFEKDLGPGTPQIAARMTDFNPDLTWKRYTGD